MLPRSNKASFHEVEMFEEIDPYRRLLLRLRKVRLGKEEKSNFIEGALKLELATFRCTIEPPALQVMANNLQGLVVELVKDHEVRESV